MEDLSQKKCVPCETDARPLDATQAKSYLAMTPQWSLSPEGKKIFRNFEFKDIKENMRFVNEIARIAEEEGHHPDLHLFYNKLLVELSTHNIGGLSENDFILAAKIDKI